AIAATDAASVGPSKIPQPWMHAYSAPERSTPSSRIGVPSWFTSVLPLTWTARAEARAGVAVSDARARPSPSAIAHSVVTITRCVRWAFLMPSYRHEGARTSTDDLDRRAEGKYPRELSDHAVAHTDAAV